LADFLSMYPIVGPRDCRILQAYQVQYLIVHARFSPGSSTTSSKDRTKHTYWARIECVFFAEFKLCLKPER
jgi:hypothetical protein